MDINIDRGEYNKILNNIKRLILSGYSDDNFIMIQQLMSSIRQHTVPNDYNKLGECVRNSYTDDCDTKELNQLIKNMRLEQ